LLRVKIDRVLNPHDMQVGNITFYEASDENKQRFSITQMNSDGTELPAVCRAMQNEIGNTRALNIAMVEQILDAPGEEEESLADTFTAGIAVGLPGSVMFEDAGRSCVLTALDGFYDFNANDQGLTSFHEGAHLMGLTHTTEQTGDSFDILEDTPECRAEEFDTNGDGFVEDSECATVDSNNFIFWGDGGPELSDDQSWVLRRHPLFYPVD